jgi:hypothetical protein
MPQRPLNLPLDNEDIWAEQIWSRTLGLIDYRVSESLRKCGKEEWYRTCKKCHTVAVYRYKCCLRFCPRCNWRRQRERANVIQHWSVLVKQPKHIVLTRRNSVDIERQLFKQTMQAFGKLRRQKEWKSCTGGCVSMETTNESKGWHVHLHVLADIRWVAAGILAKRWGELVGQEYAIVKVQDVRQKDYLNEVAKYVVKASEMAKWPAEEIAQFINAMRGVRFFAPFGSLYKLQRSIKEQIEAERPEAQACPCGCSDFMFDSEISAVLRQERSRR